MWYPAWDSPAVSKAITGLSDLLRPEKPAAETYGLLLPLRKVARVELELTEILGGAGAEVQPPPSSPVKLLPVRLLHLVGTFASPPRGYLEGSSPFVYHSCHARMLKMLTRVSGIARCGEP